MTLWRWGNFPEISKWSNYSDGSWLEILGDFFDFQMVELITLVGVFFDLSGCYADLCAVVSYHRFMMFYSIFVGVMQGFYPKESSTQGRK